VFESTGAAEGEDGRTGLDRGLADGELRRTRVLIAEDDPIMRTALGELVQSRAGLELAGVAGDADQAADLAAALRPNVAVVDVRMPGGGGIQAAQSIRRRSPQTRVVAFSAYADRGTVLQMLRAGAAEYVVKGDTDALLDAMERSGRGRVGLPPGEINELIGDLVALLRDHEDQESAVDERQQTAAADASMRLRAAVRLAEGALGSLRRALTASLCVELDKVNAAMAVADAVAADLERFSGGGNPAKSGLSMLGGAA